MLKLADETDAAPLIWRKAFDVDQKATEPDEDDLTLINRLALEPLGKADVMVLPMRLCNDQYDRSKERFPVAYLDRFAATLPGKSLMQGHDYRSEPAGRFFTAEVRPDGSGGHYLHAKAYMDAADPAARKARMGISKGVSVGFEPDKRICDLDGKDYDGWYKSAYGDGESPDDEPCRHIVGRSYNGRECTLTYGGDTAKVEALEGSLVWLGCQYGAETSRNAAPTSHGRKSRHFDALAGASGKGDNMEKELATALARVKELELEMSRLAPLAKDGEKYRAWQKQDIARLYTSLGEEKAGAALLDALKDSDAGSLESVRTEIDARHAKAFAAAGAETGRAQAETPALPAAKRTALDILFGAAARRGGF